MGYAHINLQSECFSDKVLVGYETEDAIRCWGSNNEVTDCVITDTSGSMEAHRDLIQEIALG